jgi:hypothetical protein
LLARDPETGRVFVRHEGNLTGLLASVPGLPAKQLELARDLIPDLGQRLMQESNRQRALRSAWTTPSVTATA